MAYWDQNARARLDRRFPTSETYTDMETRVLLAVCHQDRPTVRSVGREVMLGASAVHSHLRRLRDAGLIEWVEGRKSTMRSTVLIVPYR